MFECGGFARQFDVLHVPKNLWVTDVKKAELYQSFRRWCCEGRVAQCLECLVTKLHGAIRTVPFPACRTKFFLSSVASTDSVHQSFHSSPFFLFVNFVLRIKPFTEFCLYIFSVLKKKKSRYITEEVKFLSHKTIVNKHSVTFKWARMLWRQRTKTNDHLVVWWSQSAK